LKVELDSFIDSVYTVYDAESTRRLSDCLIPVVWTGEPYQLAGSAVWEYEVSLRLKYALALNRQTIYTRLEIRNFDIWLEKRVRMQLIACERLVDIHGAFSPLMYPQIAVLLMRIRDELRLDFAHLLCGE
jgi:hypothetical protein